jgi:ribosomal protein S18 acetylase RimI-like enzyme
MLRYTIQESVSVSQFRDLLVRSTLSERRPLADLACLEGMIKNSNLVATAWHDQLLVGIARSVTDFHFCCYLSDLAVDVTHQRQGIGKQLMKITQETLGPRCSIVLLAAPAAVDYYSHVGLEHHPQAWILPAGKPLS